MNDEVVVDALISYVSPTKQSGVNVKPRGDTRTIIRRITRIIK